MTNTIKERIKWVDCAKGIAILLVILGHTYNVDSLGRELIYSFHIPMFFILSGYTFNPANNFNYFIQKTKKDFLRLILPVLIIFFITSLYKVIINFDSIKLSEFLNNSFNTLIYSSGVRLNTDNGRVAALGMCWFLVSLFGTKTIYNFLWLILKKRAFILSIFLLTLLGLYCSYKTINLYFNLDVTLMILPFFLVGNYFNKIEVKQNILLSPLVNLGIWISILLICNSTAFYYFELAARRYPLFPLCYIGAISASIFMFSLSKKITSIKFLDNIFTNIGKNTFYIFCVHCIDFIYQPLWNISEYDTLNGIIRILLDLIITFFLLKIINKKAN